LLLPKWSNSSPAATQAATAAAAATAIYATMLLAGI